MATKKVMVEALVTIWAEVEVDEDEHIEEAVYRWGRYHDEDMRLDEVKFIRVLEEID